MCPGCGHGLGEKASVRPAGCGSRTFVSEETLSPPEKSAKVTIFGNDYHLKATEDPDYIERIAQYVDGKMRELQGRSTISSSTKIAILAAINIADELHKERLGRTMWQQKVDEGASRLAEILAEDGSE
jgi:cell division protein ZapA (FtsZ GTPase activity inhibitor)